MALDYMFADREYFSKDIVKMPLFKPPFLEKFKGHIALGVNVSILSKFKIWF